MRYFTWKLELASNILRMIVDKELEEKRCKGRKKYIVIESLTFDDYKTCLFDAKKYTDRICYLRTKNAR